MTQLGISINALVDGVVQLLLPLKDELSLRQVKKYKGEFSNRGEIARQLPGVFVAYTGSPKFEKNGNRRNETMSVEVWVGDKSYGGDPDSPNHGGPGSTALLDAVRANLFGVPPVPGLTGMEPVRVDALYLSGASLYRVTLQTSQVFNV